jgi:putative MATE family efflux protein
VGSTSNSGSQHQPLDLSDEHLGRTVWRLARPAVLENLLVAAIFFSDTLIVGWLHDEAALAAALLAGIVLWVSTTPIQGLGVATASLVARHWGAGETARACRVAGQALAVSAGLAVATVLALWPIAEELITWIGGEAEVIALGGEYLRIALLSSVLGLPMIVANSVIRGAGDTRTPMLTRLVMNGVNIVVSVALAFGLGPWPAMGLVGVAWGTTVARNLGGLMAMGLLVTGRLRIHLPLREVFTADLPVVRRVLHLAYPAMIWRFVASGAHLIMMWIVALLGTTAMAAHSVATHVESIAFMPAFGLGLAMTTLVGQAIGAARPEAAARAVRQTALRAGLAMLGVSALFVVAAPWIVAPFGATPEVRRLAALALRVSALELPWLTTVTILTGFLHGAGDTRSPLWIQIVCVLLFRWGAVYVFAITLGGGLAGVWIGTALFWAAQAGGLLWVFRRGAWRELHGTQSETEEEPL